MHLLLDGRILSVGQLGPDFLLLREPFDLPPANATLDLTIDDSHRSWPIRLPNGISAHSKHVPISLPTADTNM